MNGYWQGGVPKSVRWKTDETVVIDKKATGLLGRVGRKPIKRKRVSNCPCDQALMLC